MSSILLVKSSLALEALMQRVQQAKFPVRPLDNHRDRLMIHLPHPRRDTFLEVVSRFLMDDWMGAYIRHRLDDDHAYLDADQRQYIVLLLKHAIRQSEPEEWSSTDPQAGADTYVEPAPLDSDAHAIRWLPRIRYAVAEVLDTSSNLDLDGIIQFRLRDYVSMLDASVEGMVHQFLTDQEYEEFIAMLRYVLDAHAPSAETLHVFCSDERVWLCNDNGELVNDPEVVRAAEQVTDEDSVHPEDLAMSILVTRSPCKIVIHDITQAAPWPSFAETCERVFLDRTIRCHHCSVCQRLTASHSW